MKKRVIKPPNILYAMLVLLFWNSGATGQGLLIGTGAHVVTSGDAAIVISNAHWTNNGSFVPGMGKVALNEGSHLGGNYFLRGDSVTTFYHLITFTYPTAVITVQTDAYVMARWDLSGHLSSAGDADITLLPGAVLGSGSGLLAGNNGRVMTTVMLNKPQRFNPGNLGVEITSYENLGMTTIIRGFREQENAAGKKSIERYYDIIPSNQPSLPVTLRFQYDDAELNGNNKNKLAVFSGRPGSKLHMLSAPGKDALPNWVNAGQVMHLQRFTLANGVATNTPEAERVSLKAFPNPFRDRFAVTIHSDAAKNVELKMINAVGTIIERRMVQLQAGNNMIEWSAMRYVPGTYQLVIGSDVSKAIKVVKQ